MLKVIGAIGLVLGLTGFAAALPPAPPSAQVDAKNFQTLKVDGDSRTRQGNETTDQASPAPLQGASTPVTPSPYAPGKPDTVGRIEFAQARSGTTQAQRPVIRPKAAEPVQLAAAQPGDRATQSRLVVDLKRELARVGCYDGALSAHWDRHARRAMSRFVAEVNARLPTDRPDFILLALVRGQDTRVCRAEAHAQNAGATTPSKPTDTDDRRSGTDSDTSGDLVAKSAFAPARVIKATPKTNGSKTTPSQRALQRSKTSPSLTTGSIKRDAQVRQAKTRAGAVRISGAARDMRNGSLGSTLRDVDRTSKPQIDDRSDPNHRRTAARAPSSTHSRPSALTVPPAPARAPVSALPKHMSPTRAAPTRTAALPDPAPQPDSRSRPNSRHDESRSQAPSRQAKQQRAKQQRAKQQRARQRRARRQRLVRRRAAIRQRQARRRAAAQRRARIARSRARSRRLRARRYRRSASRWGQGRFTATRFFNQLSQRR